MSLTIQAIIDRIAADKEKLGITPYAPASEEEILDFERALGQELPDDFKTFYRYCDGFYSDEDMFRIVPLAEILEVRDETQIPIAIWFVRTIFTLRST